MMDHHSGEVLLHVERATFGGRQDVAYMSVMVIFWNRNYSVEFLDDMISYFGKSDNILARNPMILFSSFDIIYMSRIWSILNIAIAVLVCWLEACKNKMKEYGWGYISKGKLLDKLKDDLNIIEDQPEMIHEKFLIIGMIDPWAA